MTQQGPSELQRFEEKVYFKCNLLRMGRRGWHANLELNAPVKPETIFSIWFQRVPLEAIFLGPLLTNRDVT
jgi:hypothetical protein